MIQIRNSLYSIALLVGVTACSHMPSWMGGEKPPVEKMPGERITVLPIAEGVAADAAAQNMPFSLPAVVENPGWPQHTGYFTATSSNLALSGLLENTSSAEAGSGEGFETPLVPRPVIGDGTVFVMDAIGKLSAHDAINIKQIRWKSDGVSEKKEPEVLGGGLAFDQGKLYVTSGRGIVAAFDAATGKEIWKKVLRTPFRSAPRVADGRIFALTIDSQVVALDSASGEILWSHRGINETASIMNAVSPAVTGGDVIVPYSSGEIYSLVAANGKPLWDASLAADARMFASSFSGIGGDPVIDGEVVFAVSSGGRLGVFALATGQRLWDRPVSSLNTPWVTGDYLFVLTADNALVAFLKYDGRVRWSVKLPNFENEEKKQEPITWRGPVMVNDKLAIVGSHGEMLLINAADGVVTGKKEIPEGIVSAPVVASGRMYLVGQDATLYALQ